MSDDYFNPRPLGEALTFDQLFRVSEPKRIARSRTVSGPPLEVNANDGKEAWTFNFKSRPSTTGKRHAGYVVFKKPRYHNVTPLERCPVEVGCSCPDYMYRWAWTNKQRRSGKVGPNSISKCINRAPRVTNPEGRSGLCKHLLAVSRFVFGNYGRFTARGADPERAMTALVNKSNAVTIDPGAVQNIRRNDRDLDNAVRAGTEPMIRRSMVPRATPVMVGRRKQLDSLDAQIVSGMHPLLEAADEIQPVDDSPTSIALLTEIRDLLAQLVAKDGGETLEDPTVTAGAEEPEPPIPADAQEVALDS